MPEVKEKLSILSPWTLKGKSRYTQNNSVQKFNNLDEMDHSLKDKLPKLTQGGKDNLNSFIFITEL